jgi:type I restriction enzyme S subunit
MSKFLLQNLITKIESGSRPKGGIVNGQGNVPSLGAEHLDDNGGIKLYKLKYVSEVFFNSIKSGKIEANDILIVKDGATTGKVSYITNSFPYNKSAINEHVFRLQVDKQKANPRYIFWFLKSEIGNKQVMADFRGATVGGISRNFLNKVLVPLVPLKLQKDISDLLDTSHNIMLKRREAIDMLDEYVKSVFYEMFGDPVKNEKGWKIKPLEYFGKWQSGGTPSRSIKKYFTGNIPWYTSGELNNIFIKDSIEHINEKAINNSNTKLININSLLLGMYDTAALKSSITTVPSTCNQAIAYSELTNSPSNIFYIYHALQLGRKFFISQQRGVRQKNMNLSMIKALEIPNPDINLQNKFGKIVQQVEQTKAKMQESLKEMDNLFNSLMQRAFKG